MVCQKFQRQENFAIFAMYLMSTKRRIVRGRRQMKKRKRRIHIFMDNVVVKRDLIAIIVKVSRSYFFLQSYVILPRDHWHHKGGLSHISNLTLYTTEEIRTQPPLRPTSSSPSCDWGYVHLQSIEDCASRSNQPKSYL